MDGLGSFRTERMTASRMQPADFPELCRLYKNAEVMATMGGIRNEEETRRLLQFNLDHWDRHGFGLWMLHDTAEGRFVGRGGLRNLEVDGCAEVEVAYAVESRFWRQGYATEMARAFVGIAFKDLRLDNVVAFTLHTNRGSRRVMEKVGFHYERDIIHADLPHVLYRLRQLKQ